MLKLFIMYEYIHLQSFGAAPEDGKVKLFGMPSSLAKHC